MDPTATLVSIRAIVKAVNDGADEQHLAEMCCDLAELCEALDEWMMKGGFMPLQWKYHRRPEMRP